jgi:Family of unknown function (DUF5519)
MTTNWIIHLSKSLIALKGLTHSADSTVHRSANSHWIEIRFTKPAELERVIQLVKLALERI